MALARSAAFACLAAATLLAASAAAHPLVQAVERAAVKHYEGAKRTATGLDPGEALDSLAPPPLPAPPAVPAPPEPPALPELPDDPGEPPALPSVPEPPEAPEVPQVPPAPEVPQVPPAPEVPEVPPAPEVPEVPPAPEVPEVPPAPEVPALPPAPALPDAAGEAQRIAGEQGQRAVDTVLFAERAVVHWYGVAKRAAGLR